MPSTRSYVVSLAGSPYENGQAKGRLFLGDELLRRDLADRLSWFDQYDQERIDFETIEILEKMTADRLPAFLEELKGFAEAVDISYERYRPYFLCDWEIESQCSTFSVLPDITQDGKAYSGHSWEWTMDAAQNGRMRTAEEDNIFVISRHDAASTMGFACNHFGLWTGLNEHGVSVAPTGGVPIKEPAPDKSAYHHGLTVRMILETCASADEALDLLCELIPLSYGGGGTLRVSDASGRSYCVERAGKRFEYVQVGQDTEKYHCATNHFTNPKMLPLASEKGVHSLIRHSAMTTWMKAHQGQITREALLDLQQAQFPDGPCCHYYSSYLGTVRSMVYDLTDRCTTVSFGSPRLNPWHTYDFDIAGTGLRRIETVYEDQEADPEIWVHVKPDEEYRSARFDGLG